MAYTIKGTYTTICNCKLLCPCSVDAVPTGEGDQCHGFVVYDVREGNLDDTDLSGVSFALAYFLPSNASSGNWKVGLTVDDGASDDQADAIDRIISGKAGGPWGEFAPLIGDFTEMERGQITISDGSAPAGSVSGIGDFSGDYFKGADGSPTTVTNAIFGFAPIYRPGKATSGRFSVFGKSYDGSYAEAAEYEYSTEMG
jgi:hypothetical protein